LAVVDSWLETLCILLEWALTESPSPIPLSFESEETWYEECTMGFIHLYGHWANL
jgi:hypothetical protein